MVLIDIAQMINAVEHLFYVPIGYCMFFFGKKILFRSAHFKLDSCVVVVVIEL